MQDWYLKTLKQMFGTAKATTIYVFFYRWAFLIVFMLLCSTLVATFFLYFKLPHHRHATYMTADVIGIVPLASNYSSGIIVDARLPGGTAIRVTSTKGAITSSIIDTACVEQRQYDQTGTYFYRLRLPHFCNNASP